MQCHHSLSKVVLLFLKCCLKLNKFNESGARKTRFALNASNETSIAADENLSFRWKMKSLRRTGAPICRFGISGWEERKTLMH